MKRTKLSIIFSEYWRISLVTLVFLGTVIGVLTFRLNTMTNGYSANEYAVQDNANSPNKLLKNPINPLPAITKYGSRKLKVNPLLAHRLVNVLIGVIIAGCLFLIIKSWHTTRIAIIGTLLFVTSSWFLHTARNGSYDILYALYLPIMLCYIRLRQKQHIYLYVTLLLISSVILLYIPSLCLIVLAILIWQGKRIIEYSRLVNKIWLTVYGFITTALVAPLIWSFIQNPSLIRIWLGLPQKIPTISEFALRFGHILGDIFVLRQQNNLMGVGRLPYLDAFTTAIVLIGVYAYAFKIKLDRTRLLIGIFFVSAVLIAFGLNIVISILLPIIYLFVSAGIALLLQQWFTVFPKNPLAKYIGVAVILLSISLTVFYHMYGYYKVWPNTPDTKTLYAQTK